VQVEQHSTMIQSLQRSFVEDQSLGDRLLELLDVVFPEVELQQLANTERGLGASWEAESIPFMKFEKDKAIAHVGVLELPPYMMGQPVRAAGIHAVATQPKFRRQGHYRDCMEAALEYCDTRYETLVLTTFQPELYYPFGFRVVSESAFMVLCKVSDQEDDFCVPNLHNMNDFTLLHRLLDTRTLVSNVVEIFSERAGFLGAEASRPLRYAKDLDTLMAMEQEGDRLQLFDVVANHSLALADTLKRISPPVKEVILGFSPDYLTVTDQAIPQRLDDAYLMVRGSFAAEGQLFMLPRCA
jgi:GNAT superfamily N-acetyltransferase